MSKGRHYIALVVLFVGVAISSALFFVLRAQEDKAKYLDFNFRANTRISDIKGAIEDNLDVLRALGNFYLSSKEVEREEFRVFTGGFIERHPDIKALIWMPRVLSSEVKFYQEAASKDGYPDFKVKEHNSLWELIDATSRNEYFPVYYIEPFEENKIILGADFSADIAHFQAMEKAAYSGELTATGSVKLIRDPGRSGCKVFFPVYRKNASLETPEERFKNLLGFLAILFDFKEMVEYALEGRPRISMDTYLYDESISGEERLLYYHMARTRSAKSLPVSENDTKAAGGLFLGKDFKVGNSTWRILCRPAPKFFEGYKRLQSWSVFIIGLILTLTLLYNLFLILNRAAHIEALVKERTIELNKASLELEKLSKRIEFILGATKTGIDIIDSDYNMVYIDPEWQKVYGEYKGKKCYEYFMGAKERCASCALEKAFRTKQVVVNEEVLVKENNRPVQVITMPYQDEKGNWLVAEVNVDITERKKEEEELLFKTALLEGQSETMIDGILVVDDEGKIILSNKNFARLWHIPKEILDTRDDDRLIHHILNQLKYPNEFIDKLNYLYAHREEKSRDDVEFKDGRVFDRYSASLVDSRGSYRGRIWYFRDITERRNIEKSLKESEENFKAIYEGSNDAIMLLDEKGFFDCNKRTLEIFGFNKKEEFKETHPSDVSPQLQPDGQDSYISSMEHIQKAYHKGTEHFEWVHRRKNGTDFKADVLLTAFQYHGKTVLQAVVRDITERKRIEKAKDEFVSMVSHELRTPLTAINESIKIVLDGSAGSVNEEQKDFLDTAKNNVERLARLINSVLDFQRLQSGSVEFKMEETDINLVVKDVASSMLPLVKNKGLELNINLGGSIPRIKMDRDKITEVLTNLVNNAIKFTDKGSISVITESKYDNAISVCVRDSGIGIKKEDLDKLFTSFSQVAPREYKKTGSSGLGLAISKEIILKHGGKIWVESEPGRGSAFIFVFPIVERRII